MHKAVYRSIQQAYVGYKQVNVITLKQVCKPVINRAYLFCLDVLARDGADFQLPPDCYANVLHVYVIGR